jgi:hypothetical protein
VIRLLLALTVLKLALAAVPGGTADIVQQQQQAERSLAGRDLLDPHASNPASFLLGHYALTVAALATARATDTPFHFWIRVPAILADLALALLLLATPGAGRRAAALYMLSPVSLLLAVYHGQLHTVATALAFVALWLALRDQRLVAGIVLGLATTVRQHFAVLAVPLARSLGARVLPAMLGLVAIVLVVNLPLLTSPHLHRAAAPPAGFGTWGYTMLLVNGPRVLALAGLPHVSDLIAPLISTLPTVSIALYFGWAVVFSLRVWWRRDDDLWRAALLFLTGFYAITPGWGVQWLIWALPFWVVVSARGAMIYSALAGAFLAACYWVWRFNAKYGVESITANLTVLSGTDLVVYIATGALGIATWIYCATTAWRLWQACSGPMAESSGAKAR